jgi:hypothetical protein
MHSSTATILATPCRLAACVSDVPGISRTAGHATGQFKLLTSPCTHQPRDIALNVLVGAGLVPP